MMTIADLNRVVPMYTRLFLRYTHEDTEAQEVLEITGRLLGTRAFVSMEIYKVVPIGDKLFIDTDMPYEVFKAWKEATT